MLAAVAGYSGTPLAKKLGLKAGQPMLLLGVPANVREIIHAETLHAKTRFSGRGSYDLILVFVKSRAELEDRFAKLARCLTPAGALWVAWPKKSSGVESDLDGNVVRELVLTTKLVDVKVCAISEVWSGLKVMWRKEHRK